MQRTLFDYEETEVASDIIQVSDIQEETGNRITFPCPVARELPIGETRCDHIKKCSECQRLIKELDKIAYGNAKKYCPECGRPLVDDDHCPVHLVVEPVDENASVVKRFKKLAKTGG